MEKQIANFRNKMIGTVTIVLGLAVWQGHFVAKGVAANPYINGPILGAFLFSCTIAFVFIGKLKNEVIAFRALKEMWDDIRSENKEVHKDPLWRHYRCATPGRIFQRPRMLGHAYDLVIDELARNKKIRISVETMNTLVHKIEQSINSERSLIVYMSGLLVFMGLIGTFIGLLKMVGSIGGILGALQTSGSGGGASEAFQQLLSDLQKPLQGMTTGFASSLFGLFGSLVVGLLARFAGQAGGVLSHEFEAWLAGVVQIGDAESHENLATPALNGGYVADDGATMRLLGGVLSDYARVAGSFDHAAQLLEGMRTTQETQNEAITRLVDRLERVETTQQTLAARIGEIAPIAPALRDLAGGIEAFGDGMARRFQSDVASLRDILTEIDRNHTGTLRTLSANQLQTTTQIATVIDRLTIDTDHRSTGLGAAELDAGLDRGARVIAAEVGRVLAAHAERSQAKAAAEDGHREKILEAMIARDERPDVERIGRVLETALADGFGRIGQSMDTAFSAYSSLLRVTLARMETSEGETAARPARSEEPDASFERDEASNGHFADETNELERLLDDFRRRASAGRQV